MSALALVALASTSLGAERSQISEITIPIGSPLLLPVVREHQPLNVAAGLTALVNRLRRVQRDKDSATRAREPSASQA